MPTDNILKVDLNAAFKNAAVGYRGKAAECDARIALTKEQLNEGFNRFPGGNEVALGRIAKDQAEKELWLLMAKHADEGFYYVEMQAGGPFGHRLYPDLYSEAIKQSRIRRAPHVA